MKYHGYEVESEFIEDSAIKWRLTGNGEYIIGSRGGKKHFIKRNIHVRYPSKSYPPAVYDKYKAEADGIERKQEFLRQKMHTLTADSDHIVVEEENFWDKDNMFVTVTACISGGVGDDYDYTKLKESEFLLLSKQMAEILTRLHSCGVIHGDLKEKNVIVKKKGGHLVPYLIDFDSSYLAIDIPEWDAVGGTEKYLSPEVLVYAANEGATDSHSITEKTDIFALGVVMHRWWTGEFPLCGAHSTLAEAVCMGDSVVIDKKFNVKIGDNCGATIMSLLNWMFAESPSDRPDAKEVLAVLSDAAEIPEEFHKGNDDKPFDKELWQVHRMVAELYTVATLKKKGVKSFRRINTGSGSTGLKYQVSLDGTTENLTIEEVVNKGYAKALAAQVSEPWEDHLIEFESPAVITRKGYAKIERKMVGYARRYLVTTSSGREFDKGCEWLIGEGLAKLHVGFVSSDTPWPEHGSAYSTENMAKAGVKSISRVEVGGEHRYRIVYSKSDDGKIKVNESVSANNLKLMGYIE